MQFSLRYLLLLFGLAGCALAPLSVLLRKGYPPEKTIPLYFFNMLLLAPGPWLGWLVGKKIHWPRLGALVGIAVWFILIVVAGLDVLPIIMAVWLILLLWLSPNRSV